MRTVGFCKLFQGIPANDVSYRSVCVGIVPFGNGIRPNSASVSRSSVLLVYGNGILVRVVNDSDVPVRVLFRLVEKDYVSRIRVRIRLVGDTLPIRIFERGTGKPAADSGTGECSYRIHRRVLRELASPVNALVTIGFVVIYFLSEP